MLKIGNYFELYNVGGVIKAMAREHHMQITDLVNTDQERDSSLNKSSLSLKKPFLLFKQSRPPPFHQPLIHF